MALGGTRRARWTRPFAVSLLVAALVTPGVGATAAAASRDRGGDAGTGIPSFRDDRSRVAYRSTIRWSDVTSADGWARQAIDHVAGVRNWMRDFRAAADGTMRFRPDALAKRKHVARAIVRAFAPKAEPDPGVSFRDVDPSSTFWRFANVAVARGWFKAGADGAFRPDEPITMTALHRALVLARGLRPAVRGLNAIRTADGTRIRVPNAFATNVLGMRMELRYPSKYEDHDVLPWTPLPRIQVAYSLWVATTDVDAGQVAYLNGQYDDVVLPRMGDGRRAIVEWGVRFAGFPYVYGGEWGLKSPSPLGGQSIPGFDCSGFAWWLMRRNDGGAWKVAPPRPYRGWALPERTSATMAGATSPRVAYDDLKPGDLMFYDGNRDGVVDHVDVYVGNGWALDSSNTPAGVSLMWVGDGWYRDHFRFGRRITR
ncbi:MAG TPA: NlpC/P60 family protein [Actinomycetota bacterium]|nr:NlpC/P60 family protein [Actinomycetota bacterium]